MHGLLIASFRSLFVALIFSCAFAFGTSALAQVPGGQSAADQERARQRSERDLASREWQLRNIGKVKRVDVEVAPATVTLRMVKEEYEGLQKANNHILTMLSSRKELDYKVIADASAEIRKRAGRLKSYMVALEMMGENDKRKKSLDEIESARIKASLLSMDSSIASFIANPIFKNFGSVVDRDNSAKARDDLDNIIELSERIKRSVERTMKSARASQ